MKKGMVKGVFTSVAHNYDVMNDLMSAGEHSPLLCMYVCILVLLRSVQQHCTALHSSAQREKWRCALRHVVCGLSRQPQMR